MHAVCFERVPVEVRSERLTRHTPDPLWILLHDQRLCASFKIPNDPLGVGITQAERNTSIARDLWRLNRCRLLGKAHADCKDRKNELFHGYGQLISKHAAAMIDDDHS